MTEPDERRTEELVDRARREPRDGFIPLYERVAPAIYSWACLHLRAPLRERLEPEDLLQEVTCRAYEAFPRFDPEQSSFRAWVFGIARHVLLHALRSFGRGPRQDWLSTSSAAELPRETTGITQRVARDESLRLFLEEVQRGSEEDRLLVVYRGLEGLSHEDVASRLGLTSDAVAKRWQRLRARLGGEGGAREALLAS